jgi:putative DNA primase/helicase
MNAAELATALGAKRRGREYVARCPAHSDHRPSLNFRDGDHTIVFTCRAGCSQDAVIAALRAHGLWANTTDARPRGRVVERQVVEHKPDPLALEMWLAAKPDDGTVGRYLRNRGITLPVPPSLRVTSLGFMIAAVQAPGGEIIAVQKTQLTPEGTKADVAVPRITTGALGHGAVRLAKAGRVLGIAEGIESALSAQQLFNVPCWATLGCARLEKVAIPHCVRHLIVFGDFDERGRAAAKTTVEKHQQTRRTESRFPDGHVDWNGALQAMMVTP